MLSGTIITGVGTPVKFLSRMTKEELDEAIYNDKKFLIMEVENKQAIGNKAWLIFPREAVGCIFYHEASSLEIVQEGQEDLPPGPRRK